MNQNLILNFTDVYSEESFYLHQDIEWLDCRDISGTDCFCDTEAALEIKRRINPFPIHALHFIDSGNYHYISKFWTDRINFPFILIVFDHHPDMQPPLFQDILSCGSWVKTALDTNPNLKKVILIGPSDSLLKQIPDHYGPRMVAYSETSSLRHRQSWQRFSSIHIDCPVYISVDKDVLSLQDEHTNWDQGVLRLSELKTLLAIILQNTSVCGMDICGACPLTISQMIGMQDICEDDHVNKELLKLFLSFQQKNI